MYVPSLVLVAVSVAGVAAGCRTDDTHRVDITPAYCARLEMLRVKVDSVFSQAEGALPRIEPLQTESGAGAPPQQPEGGAGAPPQQPEGASPEALAGAPSLPDVLACVKALHVASKAAVIVGQFAEVGTFAHDVQTIAGFAVAPYKRLDTRLSASEVDIYAPDQWCIAGEFVRVKTYLAGWRDQFQAKIDEATVQCGLGADAAPAK